MGYCAASLPLRSTRICRSPQRGSPAGARGPRRCPQAVSDPGCAKQCRSCQRELMPSLENTLCRWHSAVLGLMCRFRRLTVSLPKAAVLPGRQLGDWAPDAALRAGAKVLGGRRLTAVDLAPDAVAAEIWQGAARSAPPSPARSARSAADVIGTTDACPGGLLAGLPGAAWRGRCG
jgi:hypothetical protein